MKNSRAASDQYRLPGRLTIKKLRRGESITRPLWATENAKRGESPTSRPGKTRGRADWVGGK